MPRFNGDTSISSSMDTHYKNHNRQEMISQPGQVRKPSKATYSQFCSKTFEQNRVYSSQQSPL